jgi:hypothetical protein
MDMNPYREIFAVLSSTTLLSCMSILDFVATCTKRRDEQVSRKI